MSFEASASVSSKIAVIVSFVLVSVVVLEIGSAALSFDFQNAV